MGGEAIAWVSLPIHTAFSGPQVGWGHLSKTAWQHQQSLDPSAPTAGLWIQLRTLESAFLPVLRCCWGYTWKTTDLRGGRGSFSKQNLPGVAPLLRAPPPLSGRHVLTVCKAHPLDDPPASYSVP